MEPSVNTHTLWKCINALRSLHASGVLHTKDAVSLTKELNLLENKEDWIQILSQTNWKTKAKNQSASVLVNHLKGSFDTC